MLLRLLQRRMENQSVSAHVLNLSTVWMIDGRLHVRLCTQRNTSQVSRSVRWSVGFKDLSRCSCGDSNEELHRLFCVLHWKSEISDNFFLSFLKRQFVISHKIRQTKIFSITRQFGYKNTFCQNVVHKNTFCKNFVHTKTHSVKMLYTQNILCQNVYTQKHILSKCTHKNTFCQNVVHTKNTLCQNAVHTKHFLSKYYTHKSTFCQNVVHTKKIV